MRSSSRPSLLASVVGLWLAAGLVFPASPMAAPDQVRLTAPDGALNDNFGISVAVSGHTAVVGAPHDDSGAQVDQGSAYVFTWTGGAWTQQAKLTASDGAAVDWFGFSVALSGDTAVIGAIYDDVGTNPDQGSAYVFSRTGATWTQQAKLTASDGAALDSFAYSVAVSGGTAVAGAPFDDGGDNPGDNADQGSAYVFTRSGDAWTQQAKLTASAGSADDSFGLAVGVSGDTAVIGALGDDVGDHADQGSAHVFTRAGGIWTKEPILTASDGASGDAFGFWVGVDGETAVVGAYFDDVGTNQDQGSAYVFARSGGTWTQQDQLTASDGAAQDLFGRSVAVSGDSLLVGAQWDDIGGSANQGSAYQFTRTGGIWTERARLTAADGDASDLFGISVALSGDVAVVGAGFADAGVNLAQGAAYVSGERLAPTTSVTIDVKPRDDTNRIRTFSKEDLAVAVLTTADFDATTTDPSTVCFGDEPPPGGTTSYAQPPGADADCNEAHRKGHVKDADGDGDLDMVLHFETRQTGIDPGDTEARLTGRTTEGATLHGSDYIRTAR